jgi:ribose 5-phosphate isomerase A
MGEERDGWKRAAAERAVAEIEKGMVVGLGSGSTASLAIAAIAARVAAGLRVAGIPSSEKSAAQARALGVPLTSFAAHCRVDLTIDGADQIERRTLDLVKGLGGSLLREKIVAAASRRMLVIADVTKLVERLGDATPLPVEIAQFGCEATLGRLAALGCTVQLRRREDAPFVTDNGNYIADCRFAAIADAPALEARLKAIAGVLETGLFLGIAAKAYIGGRNGVTVLER